jgi:hypothetical protein
MAIDYAVLKTEMDTDPKSLGYAGKSNPEVADLINTVGLSGEEVDVGIIDGQELSKAVIISEYTALSNAERQGWATILSAGDGQVDIDDSRVVDQIGAIWGAGTTTRANLLALRKRSASRAEVLFGVGVAVSKFDVAEARLL